MRDAQQGIIVTESETKGHNKKSHTLKKKFYLTTIDLFFRFFYSRCTSLWMILFFLRNLSKGVLCLCVCLDEWSSYLVRFVSQPLLFAFDFDGKTRHEWFLDSLFFQLLFLSVSVCRSPFVFIVNRQTDNQNFNSWREYEIVTLFYVCSSMFFFNIFFYSFFSMDFNDNFCFLL